MLAYRGKEAKIGSNPRVVMSKVAAMVHSSRGATVVGFGVVRHARDAAHPQCRINLHPNPLPSRA